MKDVSTSSSVVSDDRHRLPPEVCGFAIEVTDDDFLLPFAASPCQDRPTSYSARGVRMVIRHHGDTPESAADPPPIASPTRVLVYEGRVDNRSEVASALRQPRLASASDGVVLAAAYDAWGHQLSGHVIGEYAFVVFDTACRRIVAGQDSLGIRRVFHRSSGRRLWIASSLRLMFECFPTSRPDIDEDVLPEYFAGTMQPWSGRTIWRGVREVSRGGVLVCNNGASRDVMVWQPSAISGQLRMSPREADDAFRHLLFDGVATALRSTGPVLCDLSGGLDSSSICAVAAQPAAGRRAQPIVAWSTVNRTSNDGELQRAVCDRYGIPSVTLDIAKHLPFQAFGHSELPTSGFVQCEAADGTMREYCRTRRIRSRITGHGADALLFKGLQSPGYLSDWIRQLRLRSWARDFQAHLSAGRFSAWHLLRDCTFGSRDMHAGRFRHPLPDWLTERFRTRVNNAHADFVGRQRQVLKSFARDRAFRSTLSFVPCHGQMLPDERMPFAYRPMVEFLLGLEWEHLQRPDEDRPLLRRALADILPAAVLNRRADSRHSASVIDGLRRAWPRISGHFTGEQLGALGVVEPAGFRGALAAMRGGYQGQNAQCTNTALYLEPWLSAKASSG